jgi:hypothetical protein
MTRPMQAVGRECCKHSEKKSTRQGLPVALKIAENGVLTDQNLRLHSFGQRSITTLVSV